MKQQMTPEELAESVKRLRELYHPAFSHAVDDFMQTINALVDLVVEMSEALGSCKYTKVMWQNGKNETFWFDFYKTERAQTKSAPIATLAKEI